MKLSLWTLLVVLFVAVVSFALSGCGGDEIPSDTAQQSAAAAPAEVKTVKLAVSGLHCQGCVNSVEEALAQQEGVVSYSVSLADSSAEVKFDPSKVSPDALISTIDKTGYQASTVN